MVATVRFKDHTADELQALLHPLGADPRLVRRLQAQVLKHGAPAVPLALNGARRTVLERVAATCEVPRLTCVEKVTSPTDGFTRYLFQGDGPDLFESVRIPLLHRPGHEKYVVCVSSQVGCAMGCAFCETGRLGFRRDLATWEMVDQVLAIGADSPHPVGGVVFMGMGEPLLNLDRVLRAARILSEPCGLALAAKAITLSTSGVVPGILRLAREGDEFRLVVSLVSADEETRRSLLPVTRAWPLSQLREALVAYHAADRRRLLLAWVMIAGVNLGERDVDALARFTDGLPALLDLIPVNDPTGRFRPPDRAEIDAFLALVRARTSLPIVLRYSGGADVGGACGMLAGRRSTSPAGPSRAHPTPDLRL